MKFKYKDQIVTASSKNEAVKKITSDSKDDKTKVKNTGNPTLDRLLKEGLPIDRLKELLEKHCNFEKLTIEKTKVGSYNIKAIKNKIPFIIGVGPGAADVNYNQNKININADITANGTKDYIYSEFNFSEVGAKKLKSWVNEAVTVIQTYKQAEKLRSEL
jgi:hypothetical protein